MAYAKTSLRAADREHLPPGELLILEKYSLNPPGAGKQIPDEPALSHVYAASRPPAADDPPAVRELRQPGVGDLTENPVLAALPASPPGHGRRAGGRG